jgi:hypothetical protein
LGAQSERYIEREYDDFGWKYVEVMVKKNAQRFCCALTDFL